MKYLFNVCILGKFGRPQGCLISARPIKMLYLINVIQKAKRISLHTDNSGVLIRQQAADTAVKRFVLK
jgi:hypothetical protein